MKFSYKGTEWNTDESNRLQVTNDAGLKRAVVKAYAPEGFKETREDLEFELALISARYESIIRTITAGDFSYAGAYPDWVLDSASDHIMQTNRFIVKNCIANSGTREALITRLLDTFSGDKVK